MSDYDFILNGIRYSYSSTGTYENCPYSFKLSYIEGAPRINNFYAEYGSHVHETLEQFFTGKLESFQLSDYYRDNYSDKVKELAPTPPYDLDERYKIQGQEFFDRFSFPREKYDVLVVEGKTDFERNGVLYVAKPDLVIRNKETGRTILCDYKTSAPWRIDKRSGKEIEDKKKIKGYYNQMYLYTYALRHHADIPVDQIDIWFPRMKRVVSVPVDLVAEDEAMVHVEEIVARLKADTEFKPLISRYFCDNLCSVRSLCEFK